MGLLVRHHKYLLRQTLRVRSDRDPDPTARCSLRGLGKGAKYDITAYLHYMQHFHRMQKT